jgi:GNAT superfamily N-acetyltransferase
VGFLLYEVDAKQAIVRWSTPELYVPPALDGSGFSSRLLDAVIAHFRGLARKHETVYRLEVTVRDTYESTPTYRDETGLRADPAHRRQRAHALHFYQSRGFTQADVRAPHTLQLSLS